MNLIIRQAEFKVKNRSRVLQNVKIHCHREAKRE